LPSKVDNTSHEESVEALGRENDQLGGSATGVLEISKRKLVTEATKKMRKF